MAYLKKGTSLLPQLQMCGSMLAMGAAIRLRPNIFRYAAIFLAPPPFDHTLSLLHVSRPMAMLNLTSYTNRIVSEVVKNRDRTGILEDTSIIEQCDQVLKK